MRLVSIVCVALMMIACSSQQAKSSFPDVPEKLMVDPGQLHTIQSNSIETIKLDDLSDSDLKLSKLGTVISENYKLANRWREQVIELQLWIKTQKSLNP